MSFIYCEHSHTPVLLFCIPLHSASVLPVVFLDGTSYEFFTGDCKSNESCHTPSCDGGNKCLRKGCDRVLCVLSAWLLTHLVSWTGQNALGLSFPQKLKRLSIFTLPAQVGMELSLWISPNLPMKPK